MIDAIAVHWAKGKPLSEIGEALGISRGVVAGAIHRARGAGDDRFAPRPIVALIAPIVARSVAIVASEPVKSAPRLLIDLGSRDCRWPTGAALRRAASSNGSPIRSWSSLIWSWARLESEQDVDRTIGMDDRFGVAAHGRERLAVLKFGAAHRRQGSTSRLAQILVRQSKASLVS
jgi:hypothetical protein